MTQNDEIDDFFSMVVDDHVDFAGNNDHDDVPVLTYRWCRNSAVADCPVTTLVEIGRQSMVDAGLKRIVCEGHHLRGDTQTGQRVKMTVVRGSQRTMYLLMTAGLPGTRKFAKEATNQISRNIERLAAEGKEKSQS